MRILVSARAGLAMACATALAGAPLLLPAGASADSSAAPRQAAAQHITAKISKRGITLRGTRGLRAGRVHLTVKGQGVVEFVMFKRGYDKEDFVRDVNAFGAKGNIKAFKRALANTEILGGLTGGSTGTIVLPRRGSYSTFSIGERGAIAGPTFRVGAKKRSKAPRVDGRIIAKNGPAWGGASQLPAEGRFLLKNRGNTGVPHFVVLQQVAEGTTTDQVLEFLQSEEQGPPPSWFMPASFETGSVSPGRSMTADYDLPPGQYVVMCFFPDPNMGGMPHALMGMLRMIHLT